MAYNDYTQFPRGRKVIAALDSTPVTLFAATNKVKITHIVITTGAFAREVTFRAIDDSPNTMVVSVLGGTTQVVAGWQVDGEGVEVLSDSGTADVNLTAFTVEPTIA